jgi:predicted XRE-type DNA-binding protein
MKEEWRKINWSEDYEVSNLGRVRSWKPYGRSKNKPIKPYIKSQWLLNGYPAVIITNGKDRKSCMVHTLVAESFIGPRPDGYVIAHKDDNRKNNKLNNLRYATRSDNIKDALKNNKMKVGENHPNAKLSSLQVAEVRHLVIDLGWTHQRVANLFNVSKSSVNQIINNKKRVGG